MSVFHLMCTHTHHCPQIVQQTHPGSHEWEHTDDLPHVQSVCGALEQLLLLQFPPLGSSRSTAGWSQGRISPFCFTLHQSKALKHYDKNKYLIFKIGWSNTCTESVFFFLNLKKAIFIFSLAPFKSLRDLMWILLIMSDFHKSNIHSPGSIVHKKLHTALRCWHRPFMISVSRVTVEKITFLSPDVKLAITHLR